MQAEANDEDVGRCVCGRSPTGWCMSWHGLSSLEFSRVYSEWIIKQAQQKGLVQGRRPKDANRNLDQ